MKVNQYVSIRHNLDYLCKCFIMILMLKIIWTYLKGVILSFVDNFYEKRIFGVNWLLWFSWAYQLSLARLCCKVKNYSQTPKLQYFVNMDSFIIKILPQLNFTSTNSVVMIVYHHRVRIDGYSECLEKQDFLKNGFWKESAFSARKREVRKNKNPEALIQVIAVKIKEVLSKSVNCSSCATVPRNGYNIEGFF